MNLQHNEIKINDVKVKWINPILEQWLCIHKEYVTQYKFKDSLYWHNERANVGAFAGAVWKSGGFALEEYSSMKGTEENRANGRVDLFLSKNDKKAIAEAKMEWLYFGKRTRLNLKERIDRVVFKAQNDIVNSLHANNYELGLGLSFISTYWRSDYNAAQNMQTLREFMSSYDCAFYAIFESESDVISSKYNACNAVVLVGTVHGSGVCASN